MASGIIKSDAMNSEKSVAAWDAEARELANRQRWSAAARALSHAAKAAPHDAGRWLQIAEWHVRGGDVAAAVRTLERALKLTHVRATQIRLLLALAETHMGAQHWREGAQICREILRLDPRH